jgi:inosine-uridine nucleoside N-ribohydrolase
MNSNLKTVAVLTLLLAWLASGLVRAGDSSREPVRIIFDTDMGNDVDDAMALAMLHALETRGECRVLAVTLTKNHPLSGPFVDALNTFYGRGEIPVGVRRVGGTNDEVHYLPLAEQRDEGQLRYPHKLDNATAPDAVELLRKTLAAQPDGTVVLVQVGFFYNFASLLDAPADRELVQKKVRLLCLMGGSFQTIEGNRHFLEYNVHSEILPAQKLARDWPTPTVWSGFEIGNALHYPAVSIERDFNYAPHHIIAEAYRLYQPPPHERPTWDLTAALYAVRPDRNYFDLSPPGRVTVEADGFTRFEPQENGRDRFLVLKPGQIERIREAFVELVSQPPQKCPR